MDQFTVTPEGILYYTEGSSLYSWDLRTGEKKLLFRFLGTDISPDSRFQTCYLTVSGEHELIIYVLEKGHSMALTDTPPETEDDITCVALAGGNFVRTRAAVFSREHEGGFIKYTSYSYGDWSIPFCDMESGESHFESEEFQRLLEVCKRYGEKQRGNKQSSLQLMAEGKILAMDQFFYPMSDYTEFRAEYDEKVHFVGYPEQAEGVGVFSSGYYVVVNKEDKNKEVIAEFLNYLLSTEAQSNVDLSVVTSAALEDLVEYYEDSNGEIHYYIKTGRGGVELTMKEDGTSYMPDYIDFVNQLGVSQGRDAIWEIVEQEAEDYWNGSKSAKDVALIIDNRVQLYLDEHR